MNFEFISGLIKVWSFSKKLLDLRAHLAIAAVKISGIWSTPTKGLTLVSFCLFLLLFPHFECNFVNS